MLSNYAKQNFVEQNKRRILWKQEKHIGKKRTKT
jgi:hypothetical protein